MRYKNLGEILAKENVIAASQLEQAQRAADRSGAPLVGVLLDQGLVDEDALVRALCEHLDLKVFDPARTEVDLDAVREIPVEDANRWRLLPVELDRRAGRRVLRVAMADPLDRHAIEEIEFSTGCAVEPLIARPSDLVEAIRSNYRNVVTKIIPRERVGSGPAQRSRVVFGGRLDENALRTRPLKRVQQDSTPAHRVDALVAVLVRKGIMTQEEYEEQLRALVAPGETTTEDERGPGG